jgi:hypothetical protein
MLELAVAAPYTMHLILLSECRSELLRDPAVFAAALNDELVQVLEKEPLKFSNDIRLQDNVTIIEVSFSGRD